MAAYLVPMQQVDDTDCYRTAYVPRVMALLEKHDGDVLAGGFDAEAAEGEPPNSTVVIRFPDAAAAWVLDDPDDRPVRELRFSITSRRQAVVVPALAAAG